MLAMLDPFLIPVHHLLSSLTTVLPAAVGIILITVAVRLLLHPLNRATYRAGLQRRRLAPRLRELQRRHGRAPERLQRETLELYCTAGVSPLAGCLPALAQLPVFTLMYRLCSAPVIAGQVNVLLHHSLAGVPLTARLIAVGGPQLWVFAALVALALVAATLTYRQTRAAMELEATAGPMPRVVPLLSFGTVLAVLVLPLGTGLYLVTSALWTWSERALVQRTVTV